MNLIYDEPFIKVRPKESTALLANPHKGIATYQRFERDPLNAPYDPALGTPTDDGPMEILSSPAGGVPSGEPRSTVSYWRWFWARLEPEKGQRRWDVVDQVLVTAKDRGQSVHLRLMPVGGANKQIMEPGAPAWYAKLAQTVQALYPGHREPVYSDPEYLRHWGDLIRDFGRRYDGHPNLDVVDVSILGPWGEGGGENGGEGFQDQTNRLIDVYLESFRQTPLIALINGYQLRYGISHGCGWRADCFGDLSTGSKWGQPDSADDPPKPPAWNHMYDYYPMQVCKANAQDAWKTKPVLLESCWVPRHWFNNGWDIDWLLQQGLKYHVSVLNNKSSHIPPAWADRFAEFIKRMGYRFVLRQMMTPAKVKRGGFFWYYLWIENIGVAPLYRHYRLAFRLTQGDIREIVISPAKVEEWLPGDTWLDEKRPLPPTLRAGPVTVEIALIDEQTATPRVQFAIEPVAADGWHPLTTIEIEEAEGDK